MSATGNPPQSPREPPIAAPAQPGSPTSIPVPEAPTSPQRPLFLNPCGISVMPGFSSNLYGTQDGPPAHNSPTGFRSQSGNVSWGRNSGAAGHASVLHSPVKAEPNPPLYGMPPQGEDWGASHETPQVFPTTPLLQLPSEGPPPIQLPGATTTLPPQAPNTTLVHRLSQPQDKAPSPTELPGLLNAQPPTQQSGSVMTTLLPSMQATSASPPLASQAPCDPLQGFRIAGLPCFADCFATQVHVQRSKSGHNAKRRGENIGTSRQFDVSTSISGMRSQRRELLARCKELCDDIDQLTLAIRSQRKRATSAFLARHKVTKSESSTLGQPQSRAEGPLTKDSLVQQPSAPVRRPWTQPPDDSDSDSDEVQGPMPGLELSESDSDRATEFSQSATDSDAIKDAAGVRNASRSDNAGSASETDSESTSASERPCSADEGSISEVPEDADEYYESEGEDGDGDAYYDDDDDSDY
ncbi:hypothetical protein AURDEDRAFT_130884 [Auricularia subglabra TFB-10046 SS5]|nr:hypothetical protein AURDEDRAFT_130884 [Auricularia subglabra TFB-10046 SS5]